MTLSIDPIFQEVFSIKFPTGTIRETCIEHVQMSNNVVAHALMFQILSIEMSKCF